MPKRHADIPHETLTKRSKPHISTDWDICVLCQIATDESLQCPLRPTKQHVGSGYASFVEDLIRFDFAAYANGHQHGAQPAFLKYVKALVTVLEDIWEILF